MRIAYISFCIIPSRFANSVHVMKMCQAFAKNGHKVTLFAPDDRERYEKGVEDEYAFYGVERCFEIVKLPYWRIKGRSYLYGLNAALRAEKIAPDLVYTRMIIGCFFSALLGLPVIFESHSSANKEGIFLRWMFSSILKSSRLRRLVVITEALKHHYEIHHPRSSVEIVVAADGADPVPEDVKPLELPNKGVRLQVGYVGHLYEGKGMEVIRYLVPLCGWADFHIVGGQESDLALWKKHCSDLSNLSFYGYVPHKNAVSYIIAFDVLLLPNQPTTWLAWTSPLKMFEYMSAKKCIIASDLSILREILKDGYNAVLCPYDNVTAWKAALERLKEDEPYRQYLGENAYFDFVNHYTWQSRAKKVLSGLKT